MKNKINENPPEVSKNVINFTLGHTAMKEKTDNLIAATCAQIAIDEIPAKEAFTVLVTLAFSLLYNCRTGINQKAATLAAERAAEIVYSGEGLPL